MRCLLSIACFYLLSTVVAQHEVPNEIFPPTGPFKVGLSQQVVNHTSPPDSVGNHPFLLATLFYPTEQATTDTLPYLDPITAGLYEDAWGYPEGSLASIQTRMVWKAAPLDSGIQPARPTLVFLPGARVPVRLYTGFLSELASQGYLVIGIDYPDETPYLPVPGTDGEGIYGLGPNATVSVDMANDMIRYRADSVRALLSERVIRTLADSYGGQFNTTHFGLMSHSIGVPPMAIAMNDDARIIGAAGMDGTFDWLAINESMTLQADMGRPFFILNREVQDEVANPSTAVFLGVQSGWWDWLTIRGTEHFDFSDAGGWEEILGLEGQTNTPSVGRKLEGRRKMEIARDYLGAFWEYVSTGEEEGILEESSASFEEVVFVNASRT